MRVRKYYWDGRDCWWCGAIILCVNFGWGAAMANDVCVKVVCKDIEGKKYEICADQLVFRPSVYAVIVHNKQVLLTPNWDGYDFPGGGVKLGEPIEAALQREVKEETGLEVHVGQIILCGDSFFKMPYSGKFVHAVAHYYLCTIVGGALSTEFLTIKEKEYSAMPAWIDLSAIDRIKFYSALDGKRVLMQAGALQKKSDQKRVGLGCN